METNSGKKITALKKKRINDTHHNTSSFKVVLMYFTVKQAGSSLGNCKCIFKANLSFLLHVKFIHKITILFFSNLGVKRSSQ